MNRFIIPVGKPNFRGSNTLNCVLFIMCSTNVGAMLSDFKKQHFLVH